MCCETNDIDSAIKSWKSSVLSEIAGARISSRYGNVDSFLVRARIYARTAQALEIQKILGIPVCSCHHKPIHKKHCTQDILLEIDTISKLNEYDKEITNIETEFYRMNKNNS